jgi:LuxR family glucitol operon transcriptional activator
MSSDVHRYSRLGELLSHLTKALELQHGWATKQTMIELAERTGYAEATVYRWRQGRLRPRDETLELLARIGQEEAGLGRGWGESFFLAARHPEAHRLLDAIWEPAPRRDIPHNLPRRDYTAFIGRHPEMERLLTLLSPSRGAHLISVDGIGGVGKTTLVLESAYRCLSASQGTTADARIPTFEAIIFTSAKQQSLRPGSILTKQYHQRTKQAICLEIARTLDRADITLATPNEQLDRVHHALARQETLLIVDNLETMEDEHSIVEFLHDLPATVKVIITTRRQVLFASIRLEQLPEADGVSLIIQESRERGVVLTSEQAHEMYRHTGGIPAAMMYAVGQMAAGYSVPTVVQRIRDSTGDVARFCFAESVAPLRGHAAHILLMAVAMFPKQPLREAVSHVAGLAPDPIAAEHGLVQLQQLSLIHLRNGRCRMLPLTREYALAELAAHPEFEHEARERWVQWYLDFVRKYGGQDWQEWHIHYDNIMHEWENLQAVFAWCADQENYAVMQNFWQGRQVDHGVLGFAQIYGYWHDRLTWISWVIQAAERRGHWASAVDAMSDQGFLLSLIGGDHNLREADMLLERAWGLRDHATPETMMRMSCNIGVLRMRQQRYQEASEWFLLSENLVNEAAIEEPQHSREIIPAYFYRAESCYLTGDYDSTKTLMQKVIRHGQTINWQRAIIYAQNRLADVAIVQGNLGEAESLLRTGLPVVERNRDRRRIAFYKRSYAYLAMARGNVHEAKRWATEAMDECERLHMVPEIEEMRRLIAMTKEMHE